MLKRTAIAAMRRTAPLHFFEKQNVADRHPYLQPMQHNRQLSMWLFPFVTAGMFPALLCTILYVIYDKFFGLSSLVEHHHNRWNYGMLGKRASYPGRGTAVGMNMPGFTFGGFERYERNATNLPAFSPFAADHEVGTTRHGHGHH